MSEMKLSSADKAKADLIIMHHHHSLQLLSAISALTHLMGHQGERDLAEEAMKNGWKEGERK